MKTTCLYENEEFGNTVRDILLDKKIQTETARATEAENRLKESMVTKIQVSTGNVIKLIGLNDKVIAEAPIPAGLKTISLNGTKLTLAYADGSFKECDLASLLAEVKEAVRQTEKTLQQTEKTLQTHTENLRELSENVNDLLQADLVQKVADLEQRVAALHPTSDN